MEKNVNRMKRSEMEEGRKAKQMLRSHTPSGDLLIRERKISTREKEKSAIRKTNESLELFRLDLHFCARCFGRSVEL